MLVATAHRQRVFRVLIARRRVARRARDSITVSCVAVATATAAAATADTDADAADDWQIDEASQLTQPVR